MIIRTTKQIREHGYDKTYLNKEWVCLVSLKKEIEQLKEDFDKLKNKYSNKFNLEYWKGYHVGTQDVLDLCKSPEQKEVFISPSVFGEQAGEDKKSLLVDTTGSKSSPVQNPKCECDKKGTLIPLMADWYSEKELPFVEHLPNECKCKNELKQYERNNKIVWLCSNCCQSGDILVVQKKCNCPYWARYQDDNNKNVCGRCGGAL